MTKNYKEPAIFKIHNGLLEAYKGYFEGELIGMADGTYINSATLSAEEFDHWIKIKILADSPKARLDLYLEWNGIHGYTETLYDIAIGKIGV